ncbi:hypothetical protein LP417_19940 [Polaromonas sp. P1-6]|nr:hypothetical protein LP417_19940 [Polaromonas sp. P1-6]
MLQVLHRRLIWALLWCAITALGCVALARMELAQLQAAFETDARIAHRLLSQRVVQHDAVMATLALLQPAADASQPEQRLPSVYPQIIGVQRQDPRYPLARRALAGCRNLVARCAARYWPVQTWPAAATSLCWRPSPPAMPCNWTCAPWSPGANGRWPRTPARCA